MKYDITQNEFPSAAQRSIWHAAVFMAPFTEVTPPKYTGREAVDLREGEKGLYEFMTDLYSDMYENPEIYYIPAGEYDRFMNGRSREELTSKEQQREGKLRNQFQRPIQFYQKLLFEIGLNGMHKVGSFDLVMDRQVLSKMVLKHTRALLGEEEKRAEVLMNLGLKINHSKDELIVIE